MSSASTSQTLDDDHDTAEAGKLNLNDLPPIFISLTHISKEEAESLEERLTSHGASITYDPDEVRLVFSNVERKRRAQLDLRAQGLWTEEVEISISRTAQPLIQIDDSATESEGESDVPNATHADPVEERSVLDLLLSPTVKVIRMSWIVDCLEQGRLLPVHSCIVFEGRQIPRPTSVPSSTQTTPRKRRRSSPLPGASKSPEAILARARADAQETPSRSHVDLGVRRFGDKSRSLFTAPYAAGAHSKKPLQLLHETTSEHDSSGDAPDLPPAPAWIEQNLHYACQRRTPSPSPNEAFIDLLKEIRTARLLTGDEIGVRAYSTSIASIASYPYTLHSPREILRLPGCDVKLANLFVEYANTGTLVAATAAREDKDLTILRLFYDIWGVGAITAREFLSRGWRELDDVVEFGWGGLTRVQQIGVKYYDEFLLPIPRDEVEAIGKVVHAHAAKVRDGRVQSLIVGGYRRGKKHSGDVDVLVSHPDEKQTLNLVTDIVASLEEEGCITHTLLLALTGTNRDQQTLPFKTGGRGGGFDTLDKALVVWQDPSWESRVADLAKDEKAKNPAPHRRVDIIVAPWRTVGCAVAGWSGGTTFQRDLRRYAKNELGWKFDSSGIRDRGTGKVVDAEGYSDDVDGQGADGGQDIIAMGKWKSRAKTMEEAEKRVFEAMGLEFIDPWDRCTG